MVKEVIWQNEALKEFEKIKNYLRENFGKKSVENYIRSLDKKILSIQSNPSLYPLTSKRNNVRKAVMHKRLVIFYKYKPILKEIHILSLWDTRRNK
jgi:plasmid stabilization system protein ParE